MLSLKRYFFVFLLFIFLPKFSFSQLQTSPSSVGTNAHLLIDVLKKNHCQPRTIDDKFSIELYDSFFKNLDPNKDFFTAKDIFQVSPYKVLLDNQIQSKDILFLKKMNTVYTKRLAKTDSLIKKITDTPIDFFSHDMYLPVKKEYANSESQWEENWKNSIKYQILSIVSNSLNMEKLGNKNVNFNDKSLLLKKEISARKKVKDRNLRHLGAAFLNKSEDQNAFLSTAFLQSIANLYDQHTEYFGLSEAQEYENATNPEKEIFGFDFEENKNGEIEIIRLLPGSSAWKSGLLNNGDILLAIQWENEESIDIIGSDEEEVEEVLSGHEKSSLSLTVRKASQEIIHVTLIRAPVIQEDQSVTSYLLDNKDTFGYINLPSFYNNFENMGGLGCANDVAIELIKLSKEGIKGLVLDLRNNGGGSVKEAIDLAGIFIDQGVFGAYKDNTDKNIVVKDLNRGSIYDGPMVVLVNNLSASASEILAGILQDYNRAIIVGSPTYGKGVAQTIIPLDSLSSEPKDFAKTTVLRVFRPSGKPLQAIGVKPDIVLPSVFDSLKIGEVHEGTFLTAGTLSKTLIINPLPEIALKNLITKSNARLSNDSSMKAIVKIAGLLKKMEFNADLKISMFWDDFQKEYNKYSPFINSLLPKLSLNKPLIKVRKNLIDDKNTSTDADTVKYDQQIFDTLKKDIYISEAIQILLDVNTP
jgi:carboxyl-terminal processing protease